MGNIKMLITVFGKDNIPRIVLLFILNGEGTYLILFV